MGLSYPEAHARAAAARLARDPEHLPFMHLGENDRPGLDLERAQRRLAERTLELAMGGLTEPPRRVLEVGCGLGGNVALLARSHAVPEIVGLDLGRVQLDVARRISVAPPTRVRWLRGDATRLPLGRSTFDVVLAIECAFHFASRTTFAHEAARVLRPGGRLVLTDIVAGRAAADEEDRRLQRWIREDLAPFPDVEGAEGDWAVIGARAGLVSLSREDLSTSVAPSFDVILAGKPRDPAAHRASDDRGVAALAAALGSGLLRVERWMLAPGDQAARTKR